MSMNRRELLKLSASGFVYILSSQIFYGEKVSAETKIKFSQSQLAKLVAELPSFDGIYIIAPEKLNYFADDFGHAIHKLPLGVLAPANSTDIQKMTHFCNEKKIMVTMRGTGGAAYGQTQLDNGIIIDSTSLKKISWLSDDLVELEPGLIWTEILDFTIQKNRAVPVMPDTLVTSVGGKANVGGIGETSYNLGGIVDQIVEFDLVTIHGQLKTCNMSLNSELFQKALGSMGQFGFMTRVVMKTIQVPEIVYSRQFKYDGLDFSYFEDLKTFVNSEKHGAIAGHLVRKADGTTFTYVLDISNWGSAEPEWLTNFKMKQVGVTKKWNFYDYSNRNTKGWYDAVNSGATKFPHPYLAFYLPFERSKEMSIYLQSTALANLAANRMMLSPLLTKSFTKPTFKLPKSDLVNHFRIYRVIKNGEMGLDHQAVLKFNKDILVPKILEMGGKVYLPFSPLLKIDQQIHHFGGAQYKALSEFKDKLDKNKNLNSGAGLFRQI